LVERAGVVRLRAVAQGQEFVLDLHRYPELVRWIAAVVAGGLSGARRRPGRRPVPAV
jgi:hypothetical protein